MHELSIASAVVETAVNHATGRSIGVVTVRVGALRQVVPSSLDFYFEIVSRGTLCEGASLELETVDALLRCVGCGSEWDPAPSPVAGHEADPLAVMPAFRCTGCGAAGAKVLRGDELEVESIEVEEEACIAPR